MDETLFKLMKTLQILRLLFSCFEYRRLTSLVLIVSAQFSHVHPPCSESVYVTLCLEFHQAQVRGPGLWKFNASLLQDNEFCAIIEDRISYLSSCIDYFNSVKSWWDFFKTSLKSEIVFFLGLGADAYNASAFSLLTVLFLLSVASLRVTVRLPLKFLAWNLS